MDRETSDDNGKINQEEKILHLGNDEMKHESDVANPEQQSSSGLWKCEETALISGAIAHNLSGEFHDLNLQSEPGIELQFLHKNFETKFTDFTYWMECIDQTNLKEWKPKCDHCQGMLSSFFDHVNRKHSRNIYPTEHKFRTETLNQISPERTFECEWCGRLFKAESVIQKHLPTCHSRPRPKRPRTSSRKDYGKKVGNGQEKNKDAHTGRMKSNKTIKHEKAVVCELWTEGTQKPKRPVFACLKCNARFDTLPELEKHIRDRCQKIRESETERN